MNSFVKNLLQFNKSGYVKKENEDLSKYLLFNMGESYLPPSKKVTECIKKFDVHTLAEYPDPSYSDLRKAASKYFSISHDNISFSQGVDEAISIIPRVFSEPKSSSVVVTPTFYRIIEANAAFSVKNIMVPLVKERAYMHDDTFVETFIRTINKTKASTAWICNPNNPIGNVIERGLLEKILKSMSKKTILIVDEVYFDFYDPQNKTSLISLINKYKNLIVLRSLSKAFSLAGIRFGMVFSDPDLIKEYEYVKPVFNVNTLCQEIAVATLSDKKYITESMAKIKKSKDNLLREISRFDNYETVDPSQTNVFILKHKTKDLFEELKKKNILVADCRSAYGLEKQNYVRITVQDNKKNKKLLEALRGLDK